MFRIHVCGLAPCLYLLRYVPFLSVYMFGDIHAYVHINFAKHFVVEMLVESWLLFFSLKFIVCLHIEWEIFMTLVYEFFP